MIFEITIVNPQFTALSLNVEPVLREKVEADDYDTANGFVTFYNFTDAEDPPFGDRIKSFNAESVYKVEQLFVPRNG